MSRPVNISDTLTVIPSGYTGNSSLTAGTGNYVPANGYHDHTYSSNYARWQLSASNTSTTCYVYYTFDASSVPSNATITSVTAQVKAYRNSRVTQGTCGVQLYSNTTAKGSANEGNFGTSATTVSITNGGSWTRNELNNLRLRIYGRRSSTSNNGYLYFYGATVTINYSISGTEYEIISTLATDAVDSIDPAGQTYVIGGEDYELSIYADSIDNFIVEDNGVDVTNQLVQHQNQQGETTISKTADSFTTGFSGGTNMNFYTAASTTGNNFNYAVGHTAESPGSTNTSTWTYVKENGDSTNNTGYADFVFDFSEIPANAIIKSVQVKCYGAVESTSQSTSHADITLFSGSNQKGTMQKFTSTRNSVITISNPGTWTRAELQSAKLRFAVGYYGGHIFGITWNVTYETPVDTPYYWTYTLTNIQADHDIEVGDNSSMTKYLVSTSIRTNGCSVNNASVKQKEGTDFTLIIYYSDINNLIVTDNGVNVNSSITGSSGTYYYALTNLSSDHSIIINEKPWYEVTIESAYEDATVSVSSNKVYEGSSFTATVNVSNISLVNVKDNGEDITSLFTLVSTGVYRASFTNTDDNHEIIVVEANSYSITAISNTANATITPNGMTSAPEGTMKIFYLTSDIDWSSIILKDNSVDVTDSIVHQTAGTFNNTFDLVSFDSVNSVYNNYSTSNINNVVGGSTSTTVARINMVNGANAVTDIYCNFDCSTIPEDATITSVTCSAKLYCSAGSSGVASKQIQLCYGTTTKGTGVSVSQTSSAQTVTISSQNAGTWTREELENIKLNVHAIRGTSTTSTAMYIYFYGATLTVNYTTEENYHYALRNINENHNITVYEMFIPEEEDPEKTYYSVSVSSINATTNPANGTIRVEEGEDQTIVIIPTESNITLATDNGVDITDQLTSGESTYDITTQVSGASYGFELNNSTGYYVSTNDGVSKSASVARINFHMQTRCLVTIEYINYAEANYDYGMFGKIDTAVATDGLTASSNSSSPSDSTSNYQLAMASNSASTQTITYTIEKGEHFVDIKYGKDNASDDGNDSLQWKILSVEPLESTDLSYTINNIDEDHSLIFVFGEVVYYTISTEGTGCTTYPTGDAVVLPNNGYSLTIIPEYDSYDFEIYDNGREVTKAAEYFETERANYYVYTIKKTTTDHTIVVICTEKRIVLHIKISNSWVQAAKVYKKISGAWVEQTDYATIFDPNQIYVTGN